jgi:hypothetical protein
VHRVELNQRGAAGQYRKLDREQQVAGRLQKRVERGLEFAARANPVSPPPRTADARLASSRHLRAATTPFAP